MYGAKWLDLWAGCPMDAVKAEWARALTGHDVEAVRLALEHLVSAGNPLNSTRSVELPAPLPTTWVILAAGLTDRDWKNPRIV